MKILKVWMGRSASTGMGCDNGGYPEEMYKIIESMEDLHRSFDHNAKYYRLHAVDVSTAVDLFEELTS